ncbi:recombinase family protein [Lacrimispora sp.]|uniref:recombinase family protein n=1 Tax=Lacrimispora sp. TaxID=2719234 RepID=UPI0028A1B2F5|nr:recombinase family protein [Lacrimispora sp.]
MNKKLLAGYIRLSREDEGEGESNSIMNQRELLKNFVESSPELSQYEVIEFCDDGYSGTNFERPGVKALLEEVREGNINCIIVKDLSRFGRNYIDIGDYLEQIFPFLGVRFISINDCFDSNDFDGTTGGLDVGFRNLIYFLYSKDLSQKVRSAKRTRMEKGEFIGSHAPYGYVKSPENRKKLVIDEAAAAVVRRIFAMADCGKNAVQIAATLNSENIPTPYAYKRLKGCERKFNVVGNSNYWLNTTVLSIIRDERYTGKMVSGKNRNPVVGSKHGKRVPKSEWIVVPNTHEAIISEEQFILVQDRFSSPIKKIRKYTEVRPLLGKVKCGVCRRNMRRSNSTPEKAYYYCESHQYVADSECPKDRILESSLIQTVLSVIHTQMEVMLDMEQLLDRVKSQSRQEITALTEEIRQLQAVLTKLGASKIKMYERYKNGILDRESYTGIKAEINKHIEETDAKITELEATLQSSYQEKRQPRYIIERFKCYEGFTELSKEMVDELIDSIHVNGSEEVEIVWNHMDEYMVLRSEVSTEKSIR